MTERPNIERVSLAGPDPLDVLRALLKVDPDAPPVDPSDDDGPTEHPVGPS